MPKLTIQLWGLLCLSLISCRDERVLSPVNISSLRFIGEQVIPYNYEFQSSKVGGLSAIDFNNNTWVLLSDDKNNPRFYTATLDYDDKGFNEITFLNKVDLLNIDNQPFNSLSVDPEALRLDSGSGNIIWTSEGDIPKGVNPFVREATITGQFVKELSLPQLFEVSNTAEWGPRSNGTFEGLCINANKDGYWLSLEEPLNQDGEKANYLTEGQSPIRLSHIQKATGKFDIQHAYQLDKVVRKPSPSTGFSVNGVVEILALDEKHLLVLERSYSVGYADGGNNVRIYLVDLSEASDVSAMEQLSNAQFKGVKKTLLLDFEDIRTELTQARVDNIEGMTFGPNLPNGNRSLVLVSDNNFNPIQISQVIVFEVIP